MQTTIWDYLGAEQPPVVQPPRIEGETLEERFERFHAANPHVYGTLKAMALSLRNSGQRRWGIAALYEILRFQSAFRTNGDGFKLNNDYRALYARLLMKQEPELEGFFETRRRRNASEEEWETAAA